MNPSDDDIAFLANSENRVSLLRCLTDGPHARDGLITKVGVSRVTLGRILEELDERNWVSQTGQVCKITPLGAWVLEEYLSFSEMMAAERRLREVFQWFPEEEYGFHISHLSDAEITAVSRANASAPLSQHVRLFEGGGHFWSFSFAITRLFLESCWRHVMNDHITFEWVFTTQVLDVLKNDPEMSRQSREMLDSGQVEYRHFEADIPYIVLGSEEMVNLRLADDGWSLVEPLLEFGDPLGDNVAMRSYATWQQFFDEANASGARNYWKSLNFTEFTDEMIDTALKYGLSRPTDDTKYAIAHMGGATSRVPVDATAYPHRDTEFLVNVQVRWADPEQDEECIEWAGESYDALVDYSTDGTYMNFISDERGRESFAYRENYERLVEVKAKYDPENVFRLNQNVAPTT